MATFRATEPGLTQWQRPQSYLLTAFGLIIGGFVTSIILDGFPAWVQALSTVMYWTGIGLLPVSVIVLMIKVRSAKTVSGELLRSVLVGIIGIGLAVLIVKIMFLAS